MVAFATFGAAFFAAAAFFCGAGVSADAILARRGRPAAAVVAISLPFDVVTVAGGSAVAAAAAFAGVAFALVFAFLGGIVVILLTGNPTNDAIVRKKVMLDNEAEDEVGQREDCCVNNKVK